MTELQSLPASRRGFLTSVVPVCAATCLLGPGARALDGSRQDGPDERQPDTHEFDRPMGRELTRAEYYATRYGEVIRLGQGLARTQGNEKALEMLRQAAAANLEEYGRRVATQMGRDDFRAFTAIFKGPGFEGTLTKEVVEDTDTAFELKVTECIWARVFRDAGAGEIGHACVCHGDHAMAAGFNPGIVMERDQTLMQGDPCCNHRYLWKG
jgi:predicted ArsR family transcriptional regulator